MPSGTDADAGYAADSGAPPPASSPEGLSHALRLVLWDSLASEGMGTLTTGVFLVGLAVALDASNFMIGVLAAIVLVAGLFSLYLLGRVEERGEIKEPIALEHLVSETRRSIHSLSSAAGLYKLARFPFALLRRRL